jgi:hypothetical protein
MIMKQELLESGTILVVLLSACMYFHAAAQDLTDGPRNPAVSPASGNGQSDPAAIAAAQGKAEDRKSESSPGTGTKYSAGVNEILNMLQAGVSADVVKSYIENSPVAYELSAADLIALKKRAVPDELTMAMIKRGAALRMQVQQAVHLAATRRANARTNGRAHGLDPESYDYFHYYYLYPRTLAAANQRFYSADPASPVLGPYGNGLYGPPVFWPLPPSAFGHP